MREIYSELKNLLQYTPSQLQEIRERLIHIENKVNNLIDMSMFVASHPDQIFGGRTYAQSGEDLLLANIFSILNIPHPSYIDIGAHHPFNISNTCLLYQRGSRGINIEANPHLIENFYTSRPEDINLNIGIAKEKGTLPFYMIDDHSGRNTFDKDEAEKFIRKHPQFSIREVKKLPVTTINDIIIEHANGIFPDFLTLDVEGLDEAILRDMDVATLGRPKVICVETVYAEGTYNPNISTYLNNIGFTALTRLHGNTIFIDQYYEQQLR